MCVWWVGQNPWCTRSMAAMRPSPKCVIRRGGSPAWDAAAVLCACATQSRSKSHTVPHVGKRRVLIKLRCWAPPCRMWGSSHSPLGAAFGWWAPTGTDYTTVRPGRFASARACSLAVRGSRREEGGELRGGRRRGPTRRERRIA